MAMSDLRCIVAAFGLLVAAAAPLDSPSNQQTAQAGSMEKSPKAAIPPGRLDERDERAQPCEAGQDNRRSELCAQWKAADAAQESANWTRRTFWLGLGGVLIGFLTLAAAVAAAVYARKASLEAGRASTAAERGLDHAHAVSAAQLRPYVYFGEARVTLPLSRKSAVVVDVRNYGQTPALNLQYAIATDFVSRPIREQARELAADEWHDEGETLGPGADTKLKISLDEVSDEQLAGILGGTMALVARIALRYVGRDGASEGHDTVLFIDSTSAEDGDVLALNEWARYCDEEEEEEEEEENSDAPPPEEAG